MEALINAIMSVTIAEFGDKTQLLSIMLVARFGKPFIICCGVFIATLINHGVSAFLGTELYQWIPELWAPWIIGSGFLAVALWTLIPDKAEDISAKFTRLGAFGATCVLFFLAEIGDKTQIATVILAAHYANALVPVIVGTTLGMLLANIPAIYGGAWLMRYISIQWFHRAAFLIFLSFAILNFYRGFTLL